MKFSLRLCLSAAVFTSTLAFASENYQNGKLALQKGHVHSAIHFFHKDMLEYQDQESMHELLKLWEDENLKLEKTFFTKEVAASYIDAVNNGSPVAYNNLGTLYRYGLGVEIDYPKALMYYGLASQLGDARGRHNLGRMYQEGKGTRVNKAYAKKLYQLAAGQGYQKSIGILQRDFRDWSFCCNQEGERQPLLNINTVW